MHQQHPRCAGGVDLRGRRQLLRLHLPPNNGSGQVECAPVYPVELSTLCGPWVDWGTFPPSHPPTSQHKLLHVPTTSQRLVGGPGQWSCRRPRRPGRTPAAAGPGRRPAFFRSFGYGSRRPAFFRSFGYGSCAGLRENGSRRNVGQLPDPVLQARAAVQRVECARPRGGPVGAHPVGVAWSPPSHQKFWVGSVRCDGGEWERNYESQPCRRCRKTAAWSWRSEVDKRAAGRASAGGGGGTSVPRKQHTWCASIAAPSRVEVLR